MNWSSQKVSIIIAKETRENIYNQSLLDVAIFIWITYFLRIKYQWIYYLSKSNMSSWITHTLLGRMEMMKDKQQMKQYDIPLWALLPPE